MSNALPLMPMAQLLRHRPDLAPSVVRWLISDRLAHLESYASDTDRNRLRRQRTRARASLAMAVATRGAYALFWPLASDRLMGAVGQNGELFVSYVVAQDRNVEITNVMRRLTDANSEWVY